jgi:hypothetical protein
MLDPSEYGLEAIGSRITRLGTVHDLGARGLLLENPEGSKYPGVILTDPPRRSLVEYARSAREVPEPDNGEDI